MIFKSMNCDEKQLKLATIVWLIRISAGSQKVWMSGSYEGGPGLPFMTIGSKGSFALHTSGTNGPAGLLVDADACGWMNRGPIIGVTLLPATSS
eukprot:1161830-Pelagomonas_calceolata.AAC.3